MKTRVCILRSNPIRPDSRVEKESACLLENGYDVKILSWDRDSDHPLQEGFVSSFGFNIPIIWFGYRAAFGAGFNSLKPYLRFQYALYSWLRKHRNEYDIIHACDFDTAFTASMIHKIYGKKLVFDIFDFLYGEPKTLFQRIIRGLQNKIINSSNATIICTEERKLQIRDSQPKKLVVIHNTPPKVTIEVKPDNRINEKVKICYVGILQDWRLLEEIPEFFIENQNFELHIGGFGKYEDLYEKLSTEYENIIFYGRMQYAQTLELEATCDIILAIYDPQIENHRFAAPNKFYESLMLAKPVVMVKGTGMSNIVDKYGIGVTINYSIEGFTEGILELVKKREQWTEIEMRMKNVYNEYYCWDEMKQRLVEMYSSLI